MRSFISATVRLFLVVFAFILAGKPVLAGDHGAASRPSAALTPAPAVAATAIILSPAAASFEANRSAYELAFRRATTATVHANALRVADVLASKLGLRPGTARQVVEQYIDQQLAIAPGTTATGEQLDAQATLNDLIRHNVGGFQRTLSAVLPEPAYERYIKLLDSMHLQAE